MKAKLLVLLIAFLVPASLAAQPQPRPETLAAAAARGGRELAAMSPIATRSDAWERVRKLRPGTRVLILQDGGLTTIGQFVDLTGDDVIVRPVGALPDRDVRVPRASVLEVALEARKSVVGGVIGAAGGVLAAYVMSLHLAYKQCGRSCSDERFLIGASLVGMPVAGALLGSQTFVKGRRTTVYRRSN